nr:MAG TPA: hypothetical protein [Caudoviricetes sp.]
MFLKPQLTGSGKHFLKKKSDNHEKTHIWDRESLL